MGLLDCWVLVGFIVIGVNGGCWGECDGVIWDRKEEDIIWKG